GQPRAQPLAAQCPPGRAQVLAPHAGYDLGSFAADEGGVSSTRSPGATPARISMAPPLDAPVCTATRSVVVTPARATGRVTQARPPWLITAPTDSWGTLASRAT